MNEIVKTENAKCASRIIIVHCPGCGCDVYCTEDDLYDNCLDDGTYQTCVVCPKCKNEIEL